MSNELQDFFLLKQKYRSSRLLVRHFLLRKDFEELASSVTSPALKKTIREFIGQEKAEQRLRAEASRLEYQSNRDKYVAERMEVMGRWKAGEVQRSTAASIVEASAWWLTHSSGHPVRAPRHADRIEKLKCGWSIEFGPITFWSARLSKRVPPPSLRALTLLAEAKSSTGIISYIR